jgi:hypothetical protein
LGLGLSGLECLSAVKELFRITGKKVPFPAQYVPITYTYLQKGFNPLNDSTLSFMSKICM